MHFLAILATGVILWMLEIFDQYVVALMLLLSWIVFGIVPPEVALSGFSQSSWFFVLGVLGLGAAVTKTGLLYRLALKENDPHPRPGDLLNIRDDLLDPVIFL